MDAVKEECAVLGERMSQVPKNSGEAKVCLSACPTVVVNLAI